ncbi:MAG TPA: hypothetical protein VFE90_09810 [Myxococcales bacterium]|jgi:hypothetical protein|nr:hypothetical protein [Myxococcales bacterium]
MSGAVLALLAAATAQPARPVAGVLVAHGCNKCHDGALATAKPKALAVFDLRDEKWEARMSEPQLHAMLGRLRSAPAADRAVVQKFVDAELDRRKGAAGSP